jgi:hypothetical protein
MKYECGMQASEFDPKPPVPQPLLKVKERYSGGSLARIKSADH